MDYLWEEIGDNEVLGNNAWYLDEDDDAEYEKVTNDTYFNLTGHAAKLMSAKHGIGTVAGRKVLFFKRVNQALKSHQEMESRVAIGLPAEEKPGHPFNEHILKDKFTIDKEEVGHFYGRHARSISALDLIPVLQQIMTNQKEIMEILNTRPEDKMIKEKFLEEFDKTMQKVIES